MFANNNGWGYGKCIVIYKIVVGGNKTHHRANISIVANSYPIYCVDIDTRGITRINTGTASYPIGAMDCTCMVYSPFYAFVLAEYFAEKEICTVIAQAQFAAQVQQLTDLI